MHCIKRHLDSDSRASEPHHDGNSYLHVVLTSTISTSVSVPESAGPSNSSHWHSDVANISRRLSLLVTAAASVCQWLQRPTKFTNSLSNCDSESEPVGLLVNLCISTYLVALPVPVIFAASASGTYLPRATSVLRVPGLKLVSADSESVFVAA